MMLHLYSTDTPGSRLDCEGYIPPKHTAKTVETKTRGMTGTFGITGGIHPTGTGTVAINHTKATAKEKQNDRVFV
jgi:hypothetical protein